MSDQFPPRRAESGQRFVWRDAFGVPYETTADDDGLLHPKNAGQERLADAFGLPVARKSGPVAKARKTKARKAKAEPTPAPELELEAQPEPEPGTNGGLT